MTTDEQRLFNERAERLESYRQRIGQLEADLAEARKDGERLALVQAAADRYFEAYTTAERERVALVKRSHNQRLEIARLQALRGTR